MRFYHYSKNVDKISQDKFLLGKSFSKTNTYDFILESCPELLVNKSDLKKLSPRKVKDYESKYSHIKLKFKNQLLDEFFSCNKYILAFDEKLPKGWIKSGMFQLLVDKIGNEYLRFEIDIETAKISFVLEQKYWSPEYSLKKFGVNSWDKNFKIKKYPKIVKSVFGNYYLSIKRLSDYKKGDFEVPEFWICGKIPIRNCKKGEVPKKLIEYYINEGSDLRKEKI